MRLNRLTRMTILVIMAKQKLKDKKKKTRERANKVVVQKRRDARRRELKKKKEWEEQVERESGIQSRKTEPYVCPETRKRWAEERDVEIQEQLERNIEILKALEDQYLKEKQDKTDLGAELEAEGHHTIEEKLNALNKRAQEKVEVNNE